MNNPLGFDPFGSNPARELWARLAGPFTRWRARSIYHCFRLLGLDGPGWVRRSTLGAERWAARCRAVGLRPAPDFEYDARREDLLLTGCDCGRALIVSRRIGEMPRWYEHTLCRDCYVDRCVDVGEPSCWRYNNSNS